MDPETLEALKALGLEFDKAGGWGSLAAVVGALIGVIRLWRLPKVQGLLERIVATIELKIPAIAGKLNWLLWDRMPDKVKWLVPAGLAVLAGVVSAATGVVSWPMAAVGALTATVGAWLGHGTTKVMGSQLDGVMVKFNPNYEPGAVRNIMAIALPKASPKEVVP